MPVHVFSGTPEQAIAEAARSNTRAKLAMSRSEKLGTAWRLVVTTEMTKAGTMKAAGVSDGTVANMRRVRDQLKGKDVDVADRSWEAARQVAMGQVPQDIDWEERTEKEADEPA